MNIKQTYNRSNEQRDVYLKRLIKNLISGENNQEKKKIHITYSDWKEELKYVCNRDVNGKRIL